MVVKLYKYSVINTYPVYNSGYGYLKFTPITGFPVDISSFLVDDEPVLEYELEIEDTLNGRVPEINLVFHNNDIFSNELNSINLDNYVYGLEIENEFCGWIIPGSVSYDDNTRNFYISAADWFSYFYKRLSDLKFWINPANHVNGLLQNIFGTGGNSLIKDVNHQLEPAVDLLHSNKYEFLISDDLEKLFGAATIGEVLDLLKKYYNASFYIDSGFKLNFISGTQSALTPNPLELESMIIDGTLEGPRFIVHKHSGLLLDRVTKNGYYPDTFIGITAHSLFIYYDSINGEPEAFNSLNDSGELWTGLGSSVTLNQQENTVTIDDEELRSLYGIIQTGSTYFTGQNSSGGITSGLITLKEKVTGTGNENKLRFTISDWSGGFPEISQYDYYKVDSPLNTIGSLDFTLKVKREENSAELYRTPYSVIDLGYSLTQEEYNNLTYGDIPFKVFIQRSDEDLFNTYRNLLLPLKTISCSVNSTALKLREKVLFQNEEYLITGLIKDFESFRSEITAVQIPQKYEDFFQPEPE